jgi:hypothetical protein
MADLYNLADELEENVAFLEDDDNDNDNDGQFKANDPRRETVETMAMSEYDVDDEEHRLEFSPEIVGRFVRESTTPRNARDDDADDADDASNNNNHRDRDAEAASFFADLDGSSPTATHYHHHLHPAAGEHEKQKIVPNELYGKLQQHWLRERHCPELLPYDEEMVRTFLEDFEENQEKLDDLMTSSQADELLIGNILQQDLDRAKFVLSDWLTQRLNKIEQHPLYNLNEKMEHMSEHEKEHLQAYATIMKKLLYGTVLNNLKEAWRTLDEPKMIDKPDYEGYHFWLVKEDIVDKNGQAYDVGDCLVAKYVDMRELMTKNKVELRI